MEMTALGVEREAVDMELAIETRGLTCTYGRAEAVHDLTLRVPMGSLFALLGPNGAGKTTTIRTLMNIRRPSRGAAVVLGMDSQALGPSEFQRIGHVAEGQRLPGWMTVSQFLEYCRPFYPSWDEALCRTLVTQFDLPLGTKIARLSRGMRIKVALVSSLAYRPTLLVLDEPFGGLDPVVRDDLVRGVLELAGEERWTVFISSHDLDEVERLVDEVAYLDAGRLVLSEPLNDLHARFRRIEVTTDVSPTPAQLPAHWIDVHTSGRVTRLVDPNYRPTESERAFAAVFPSGVIDVQPMTLREIFVALARQKREVRQ
jgi:ABC-2 type transport system ATP-binding protein